MRRMFAPLLALVLFALAACGGGGEPEATVGTDEPSAVAREMRTVLDGVVAGNGLSASRKAFTTAFCEKPKFDNPPKDRFKIRAEYDYPQERGMGNEHVRALFERWQADGWGAEEKFDEFGYARASAIDPATGYYYAAWTDWLTLKVWVISRCHRYPEGSEVYGEVDPDAL
ncbi:hypothetical protein [Actinorhabdospora filicis]|nr:hypothetical protein [Actinorhabdospora filicis]